MRRADQLVAMISFASIVGLVLLWEFPPPVFEKEPILRELHHYMVVFAVLALGGCFLYLLSRIPPPRH